MSNDKMLEEFERTNGRDHRRQPPKGNNYIDPMAQADWESFQKGWAQSREALMIELPDRFSEAYQDYFDDVEGGCFNESRYINDLIKSLEASGLKVKS
ncbi:hypothetical protein [Pseudomonas syringae]|uniref:hypothetical protein n=1 Tax=Pseudomonas syringae TaxID=317 RepID=UPI000A1EA20A|nr:hypothetical protein [Pseudomonas syringae]OSN39537.1 hypothetical protein BV342_01248 [Pseudomonas syringae pv. actinidiae]OSR62616.1 hypothetical protein BV325_01654 [Pseudomonas syringae pv. actinidiae]OSR79943.1 hypothetical protein BV328_01640 [Pseudomonas syringae pv. actinidiae]